MTDCPLCSNVCFTSLGVKRGREVFRCGGCKSLLVPETLFADPKDYLKLYLDDELYHRHWMKERGYPAYKDRFNHDYVIGLMRLDILKDLVVQGPLLDIGSSNGAFVRAAVDRGYCAMGVEANPEMAAYSARHHNILTLPLTFPDGLSSEMWHHRFRVVTLHDVLEHLLDIHGALETARDVLVPGGMLVVDTPNASSEESLAAGIEWKHVKPEEHPWLFGQTVLLMLFEQHSFDIVTVDVPIPGKMVLYACAR